MTKKIQRRIYVKVSSNFNFICILMFITFFSCYLTTPIVAYGFQLIGVGILGFVFFIKSKCAVSLKNTTFYILFCFLLVLVTFIQSFYLAYKDLLWLQVARILFWFYICYISYPFLSRVSAFDYERALKVIIVIFSLALIFQFFAFYVFNIYVDYSQLLGGIPSRMSYGNFVRPSGFTSEPAIHSGIMIGLLTLLFILNKDNRLYFYIGLLSIFLSMSILGIIMGVFFIFLAFGSFDSFKKASFVLFLIFLVTFFTGGLLVDRYDAFASGNDGSNLTKVMSVSNMLENDSLIYLGYGFNGSSKNTPWYYEGMFDVTAFGSFFIAFGIPIGIAVNFCFLIFIVRLNFSLTEKALVCLSLAKLTLPIICFFVFFVMAINLFSRQREYSCGI